MKSAIRFDHITDKELLQDGRKIISSTDDVELVNLISDELKKRNIINHGLHI